MSWPKDTTAGSFATTLQQIYSTLWSTYRHSSRFNLLFSMKTLSILVSSFAAGAALASVEPRQPRSFQVGQGVWTTSGLLTGKAAPNRTEVSEYLGVPYGAPPVGQLRFAAPEPYIGNGNINATSFVCRLNALALTEFANTECSLCRDYRYLSSTNSVWPLL